MVTQKKKAKVSKSEEKKIEKTLRAEKKERKKILKNKEKEKKKEKRKGKKEEVVTKKTSVDSGKEKHKVLIANRGEIACRIIRSARKMGFETVAVYSEVDSNSLHVIMADEAVNIGPAPSNQSYLDIKKIIQAVRKSGATMVHPGYGFLSENPKFAKALEKEGVIFIGPSVKAIEAMGDKIKSKKLAKAAGVSSVPGHLDVIQDTKEAVKIAEKIGFPVMVKASAGGGGKGMRIVNNKKEMADAFESATNEARNSFGDDRIFIEKYIENPRHIEIQVLADKFGNILCLGERECSIQRNHQKVIEEAPSSFVDEKTREKMYHQARLLVKKVGYYSAGTIEFVMDNKKNFYFLEMNTRLQVEHPVTELITGIDIVEQMINVALDQELPYKQKDIELKGWAMECRINSEDPARGFMPSSGRISQYIEPQAENGELRIESGIYEGGEVSMFYDSMIVKLCSYGENRTEAIRNMKKGLSTFYISGISHNISFLETIMQNRRFIKGDLNTHFIKEEFPEGFTEANRLDSRADRILIAAAVFVFLKNARRMTKITGRLKEKRVQVGERWVVSLDDEKHSIVVNYKEDGSYGIECENEIISVESSYQNGEKIFRGLVNNRPINVKIIENNLAGSFIFQYVGSNVFVNISSLINSEFSKFMPKVERIIKPTKLTAPITGKIVKFKVKEGDEVSVGKDILLIEAMKMENTIRADYNYKIKRIFFKEGDLVGVGETIMEFEEDAKKE